MPFSIIRDNIVKVPVEAIVNAANNQLQAGGGVCGVIFEAAGKEALQKECDKIGFCKTGEAVLTKGYQLNASYIIHTVGPVWRGGQQGEEQLLRNCYRNSLHIASKKKMKSIAFPLISSGIYGYPKEQALQIAIEEIKAFLEQYDEDMEVILVVFDKKSFHIGQQRHLRIQEYIDDRYVEPLEERWARRQAKNTSYKMNDALLQEKKEEKEEFCYFSYEEFQKDLEKFSDELEKLDKDYIKNALECYEKNLAEKKHYLEDEYHFEENITEKSHARKEKKESLVRASVSGVEKKSSSKDRFRGLLSKKASKKSLEDCLNKIEETFSERLLRMIDERGKKDSDVYKKANIDRKHFSKIRSNPYYTPTKKTVIAFAIALELNLDDAKDLLASAGYALSRSSKFDIIIEYYLENEIYDIFEINEILFAFEQPLL